MPRAKRVCPEPGCPRLTDGGRCVEHRRQADRARGSGTARGFTRQWQSFRRRYLRQHPLCLHCGAPATDIDHIDGGGRNGPRAYDPSNLRSLCHSCHSKRTARDQPGGWNAPLTPPAGRPGVSPASSS